MWTPPSPETNQEEVEEEPCIAVDASNLRAIPFFTHESGAIFIKGGTVVNDDNMEVADVIIEEGKIAQVGQDLEVPSGKKNLFEIRNLVKFSLQTFICRSKSD